MGLWGWRGWPSGRLRRRRCYKRRISISMGVGSRRSAGSGRRRTAHPDASRWGPCSRGWLHPSARRRAARCPAGGLAAWRRHGLDSGSEVGGLQRRGGMRTVVAEVEAAVDPDAAVVHGDVLLRANRPLAVRGDPFSL